MNRFIVISLLFLSFPQLVRALYIPKNLKPVYLKQNSLPAAVLSHSAIMSGTQYTKLFLYFSSAPDSAALKKLGIIRLFGTDKIFSAYVPYQKLSELQTLPHIQYVRKPDRPYAAAVEGEELNLFNTFSFTSRGFDGREIDVAVCDLGFYNYQDAINNGDLPADIEVADFSTYSQNDTEVHGTAVAEIIHETAPAAKLHLIKIDDSSSLWQAKEYCEQNNIRVINCSAGWFTDGWGSGDGWIYNNIIDPLYEENILWINSAGNEGDGHYQAVFNNDGTGWHKFKTGSTYGAISNLSAGTKISITLKWNAYDELPNGIVSDYDLYLYNPSQVPLTNSADRQSSSYPFPYESIDYTAASPGTYYYRIKKYSASYDHEFQIFAYNLTITPNTPAKSILSPADGDHTLAVGAVAYSNWTKTSPEIEYYSSRGPSQDGRIKPDISGIDGMTNFSAAQSWHDRFWGTSAAAPSVTGLAALILSKQFYLSAYQLFYILKDNAADIGPTGDDNTFGAGKASLNLIPFLRNNETDSTNIIVAPTRIAKDDKYLYYYGISEDMNITLRTAVGRIIKTYSPQTGIYTSGENRIDISPLHLAPGIYLVEFKTSQGKIYVKKIIVNSH